VFSSVTQVAIIGAGPYGLSIAAHLRSRGVPYRIFGTPVDTWRQHMPAGMTLKSDAFASCLSDPDDKGTLAAYCAERDIPYHPTEIPVKIDDFTAYALDFQRRFVPDVEDKQVISLEKSGDGFSIKLDDGESLQANFVVGAVGITHFAQTPPELTSLPAELATHASAHHDLSPFAGREVIVIGAGSSAVDIATLLSEAGAKTSLVTRAPKVKFGSAATPGGRSPWQRMRHPSTGLGPGWRSWLCENVPALFRFLPGDMRLMIIKRHLGPFAAGVMKARFDAGVSVSVNENIVRATEDGGRVRLVLRNENGTQREVVTDHIISATGYSPDVSRLTFFSDGLRSSIRTHAKMPVLSRTFESSVPGLYFVGPPAVNTFGPLMRFMVGSQYVAPRVARDLARKARRTEPSRSMAAA
jgi:cation diffusion facilitator CzcD-associated flavoprotein CzcO